MSARPSEPSPNVQNSRSLSPPPAATARASRRANPTVMFAKRQAEFYAATVARCQAARTTILSECVERAAKKAKTADPDLGDPDVLNPADRAAWFEIKRGVCPQAPASTAAADPARDDDVVRLAQRTAEALQGRLPEGVHHDKLVREYALHFGTDIEAALRKMDTIAVHAYINHIKHTTRQSYASAVARWEFHCAFLMIEPYPVTETMCELFAAASSTTCTVDTISQYLTAVRDKCIGISVSMPERSAMPRLQRTLRGLKMAELQVKDGRVRMALTFDIGRTTLVAAAQRERDNEILGVAAPSLYSTDNYKLLRAVISLPLVALLRPSEAFVRTTSKGIVSAPLLVKHWCQINHDTDSGLIVGANLSLPHRKTDQFGARSMLYVGPTGDSYLCAVSAVNDLLVARQQAGEVVTGESPLLLIEANGERRPMTYADLTATMSKALRLAGFDDSKFKGHSFRYLCDRSHIARGNSALNTYFPRPCATQLPP